MVYYIVGAVFLLFFLIMYLSYSSIKKNEINMKEKGIITEGMVSGYPLDQSGSMEEVYVTFTDKDGNEKKCLSQSFRPIKDGMVKTGMKVKIQYLEKITFGIKTYELKVIDDRYIKESKIIADKVLKVISMIFLLVAIVMFVLGIIL